VSWAVWLSIPVVVTLLAALLTWLRSRPRRVPTTQRAMQAHSEYLDALIQTARSKDRGPLSGPPE
jgi:cytochrome c-type biogenesis protein CcmH/NrfF